MIRRSFRLVEGMLQQVFDVQTVPEELLEDVPRLLTSDVRAGWTKTSAQKWLWVKTNEIPFWGRCTTHVSGDFSGDWDVHWGLTGILTHGQIIAAARVQTATIPGSVQSLNLFHNINCRGLKGLHHGV